MDTLRESINLLDTVDFSEKIKDCFEANIGAVHEIRQVLSDGADINIVRALDNLDDEELSWYLSEHYDLRIERYTIRFLAARGPLDKIKKLTLD